MDGYVVAHSEIVGFEQDAMRRFLREALENPASFSEQFEFGVTSAMGSCAVQHVDELRETARSGMYRIDTSCSSAVGDVQILIRYDSIKHQIAASMINSIIDLQIAPIQDMQFALAYEIVKGSYRENSLPAEF